MHAAKQPHTCGACPPQHATYSLCPPHPALHTQITKDAYAAQTGKQAKVGAIHAGLVSAQHAWSTLPEHAACCQLQLLLPRLLVRGCGQPGLAAQHALCISSRCGKESCVLHLWAGLPRLSRAHTQHTTFQECGIINAKFPGMDSVSWGPTIRNAHSPDEKVEVASVLPHWELTLGVLSRLADIKA